MDTSAAHHLHDRAEQLQRDPRNYTTSLDLEVRWKDYKIRAGEHDYMRHLIDGDDEAQRICGAQIIQYCRDFHKRTGLKPRVLDFACGPISSLAFLAHQELADVVGVDVLAPEYTELFAQHGLRSPVVSRHGAGESLRDLFDEEEFDLVHVRNALDHCQVPATVWLNLLVLTRVGGVLCHSHSVNEGEKEKYKQLHQFNLFAEGESLWISDRDGFTFSLTDHLPLEKSWFSARNWVAGGYVRTAGAPEAQFYALAHQQAMLAYKRRDAWARELELYVRDTVLEQEQLLPSSRDLSALKADVAASDAKARGVEADLLEARRRVEAAEGAARTAQQQYQQLAGRKVVRLGVALARPMKPALDAIHRFRNS